MRIEKIDKLPDRVETYKWGAMQAIVKEFLNSGLPYAELKGWTHIHANSCVSSFNKTARTMRAGVKALNLDGRVYLVKE